MWRCIEGKYWNVLHGSLVQDQGRVLVDERKSPHILPQAFILRRDPVTILNDIPVPCNWRLGGLLTTWFLLRGARLQSWRLQTAQYPSMHLRSLKPHPRQYDKTHVDAELRKVKAKWAEKPNTTLEYVLLVFWETVFVKKIFGTFNLHCTTSNSTAITTCSTCSTLNYQQM